MSPWFCTDPKLQKKYGRIIFVDRHIYFGSESGRAREKARTSRNIATII